MIDNRAMIDGSASPFPGGVFSAVARVTRSDVYCPTEVKLDPTTGREVRRSAGPTRVTFEVVCEVDAACMVALDHIPLGQEVFLTLDARGPLSSLHPACRSSPSPLHDFEEVVPSHLADAMRHVPQVRFTLPDFKPLSLDLTAMLARAVRRAAEPGPGIAARDLPPPPPVDDRPWPLDEDLLAD